MNINKAIVNIKDISTHRSELMGWSILWIMMLHFTFTQVKPLGFIAQYGFAGVDIFMLVSGLGLFFSLEKDSNLAHFYKKRLLRIFPTYFLLGGIINLLQTHDDILTYLFRYSTIGFWTGGGFAEWFIPSLVILYLLAPLVKATIDKRWFVLIGAVVIAILLVAYYFTDKEHIIDREHFFFLYRIPAFIFGMICAYWIKNNVSMKWYFLILLTALPFFIWFFPLHHQLYIFKYYSLAFLLPVFTLCFVLLSKYVRFLSPVIKKMGEASLEIYLIQGIFFTLVISGKTETFIQWHDVLTILMIVASTLLGIASHWLIDKVFIHRLL